MKKLLSAALLFSVIGTAFAQYPNKSIRLVVGFPPGGSADPTARIIGAALAEQLGQPVVVENRPGADSAVAALQVTQMPADGYNLFFGSNSGMTAAVALKKEPTYDPLTQFTQISLIGRATVIMYAHPSVPGTTLRDFIAHAKANPGKLAYGTGNALSILYNVQLMNSTGIDMLHVPYKGEGPVLPDLLTGRVHSSFLSTATAMQNAKDGKFRALAVLLEKRSPLMPDVPTIAEAGAPGVTVRQWAGLFGPAKMPRDIVVRLNKEIGTALGKASVQEQLLRYGYSPEPSTPERLLEINREDLALWRKLIVEAKLPLE